VTDAPIVELEPVVGLDGARASWGANCGPVAIAAALGVGIEHVRAAVSGADGFQGYMGVLDFRAAIPRAGGRIVRAWSKPIGPTDVFDLWHALAAATEDLEGAPVIVLLRFCGPWDSVPRASATYRHAIAYRRVFVRSRDYWTQRAYGPGWVFDVNSHEQDDATYWMPSPAWRNQVLIDLLPARGTEQVAVDWMAQVERVESTGA
jgi:hypothetical protein